MDRLQAMKVFVRIVEMGGFSKAAEHLNISRASATLLIKQLESHLGARLLQRTTRQVHTTQDGQSYYQHCLNILSEIDEAESVFLHRAVHPHGRLKIDLPASFARQVVIPKLTDFYEHYPDITLEIGIGDRMINLVAEGVDCVVRIGELCDSTLVMRALVPLTQVTCASADYVARQGQPASLEQLDSHQGIDFLSATTGQLQPLEFNCGDRIETRCLPACLAVRNGDSYVAACEAGLGIVQVPRYHVASQLLAGTLIELLPQNPPPDLPMAVLYPHHRHLMPRLRVFIEWLSALLVSQSPGRG